jgi:hypothetical protein
MNQARLGDCPLWASWRFRDCKHRGSLGVSVYGVDATPNQPVAFRRRFRFTGAGAERVRVLRDEEPPKSRARNGSRRGWGIALLRRRYY